MKGPRKHKTVQLQFFVDAVRETLKLEPLYRPKYIPPEEQRFFVSNFTLPATPTRHGVSAGS